jgi:biotin--protein ligase
MREVLVYADGLSADALVLELQKKLPSHRVKKVDSAYLKDQAWEDKTATLVMGAGKCTEWESGLGEEGVKKIHDYVVNGGHYLGFCAGAYFASSQSCFQGREKTRALSLFEGKAIGPLWNTENYLAPESAKAAKVSWTIGHEVVKGKLYYLGGCYFEMPSKSSVKVVGVYEEIAKPAAILCTVGKGKAFLCGLHPEFVWKDLTYGHNASINSLIDELQPEEPFREKIWSELLKEPETRWIDALKGFFTHIFLLLFRLIE